MLELYVLIGSIVCLIWIIMIVALILNGFDILSLFLNPIDIYNIVQVNVFGCILLTLISNIILLPYSIIYWLYKLCTYGR